ncbi:MAG TPA: rRNA maturation RNase YbeY [Soehngenia sp.]|nr:rRNA maturation RNase YbeY [Soehngenia sp.]HPP31232.1 rRNA maturation RNase YbeY [Soehngenia sp.]
MRVLIDNRQLKINIDDKIESAINESIKACLQVENRDLNYEVSVSFVDNDEIKQLNKEYRNVDKPTDVLSFPLDDYDFNTEHYILGDIIISTDKVIEQATEFGHSILREIIYLTVHSMFHLLGYDHMNDDDKKIMREKEKIALKEIGVFRT